MTDPSQMSDAELMAALGVSGSQTPARQPSPRRAQAASPRISFANDQDAIIRTVIGEARGESPQGRQAVAAVIRNRARQRGMTPTQVVLEANQFEPWGNASTASRLMDISADDPLYREVAAQIADETDPTGGASHFYAPKAQEALGRAKPSWDNGTGTAIGNHLFFNLDGGAPATGAAGDEPGQDTISGLSDEELLASLAELDSGSTRKSGMGVSRADPIDLSGQLYQDQVDALKQGVWVRDKDGNVFQATGDAYMAAPGMGDERQGDNVYVHRPTALDTIGGFATAASEQVPFGDESLAALVGALSGRGYDALREQQQLERRLLDQTQGVARDVGGVAGFGLGLLAPGASFIGRGGNLLGRSARAAGVGGATGAVYGAGAADDGGLGNRLHGGAAGGIIGSITGGATPGAANLASNVWNVIGRPIGRAANSLTGGRIGERFSPENQAYTRLGEALEADGATMDQVREAVASYRASGVEPSLLDAIQAVAPGGRAARLIRGSALEAGPASVAAERYAENVAGSLYDNAQTLARNLSPNARPTSSVVGEIEDIISNARPVPSVGAGEGGAALSGALNQRRDEAWSGVNAAYNAARDLDPGRAMIPGSAAREVQVSVLDAVRDFDMRDVPRVGRVLEGLGDVTSPSVRSLFEARSRLTNLRASNDRVESAAASRAVRALDSEIDRLVDSDLITGDVSSVSAWREANKARREFGRIFEGDDLVQRLTQREYRGGGMTNAVSPEDASMTILGRSGVVARPNLARDLRRLQRMAPNEFAILQQEALGRLVPETGDDVSRGLNRLAQQSPEIASTVVSPSGRAQVAAAQREINAGRGRLSNITLAQRIMNAGPDEFGGITRNAESQGAGVQSIIETLGRGAEGSTGSLRRLASGPNVGQNLATLYGDDAASRFRGGADNLLERLKNARFIASSVGSQTAPRLMDAVASELPGMIMNPRGLVVGLIEKLARGATLTKAEREAIVRLGISEADVRDLPIPTSVSQYLVQPVSSQAGQTPARVSSQ